MSLPRTPEPASDDVKQESLEYHLMDHFGVNQTFVDDLMSTYWLAVGRVADVVDLGSGTGAIAILLCRRCESVRVMAIDNEVEMLEIAKLEIDIAGMLDRITLRHADICDLAAYDDSMADAVISNTVLHHLDDPGRGLASAIRLARPGGRVFIRDLFRPDSETALETLVQSHAADQSSTSQQLLRQSLWASLTLEEIRVLARGLGIDPSCVQMTSDRHWTLDWVKPH